MRPKLTGGLERLEFPFVKKRFKSGGTQLFQPMVPFKHFFHETGEPADFRDTYDTDYVRNNCMDFDRGKGVIFRRDRNSVVRYPDKPSLDWIPKQRFLRGEILYETGLLVGELLEDLFLAVPPLEDVEPSEASARQKAINSILGLHRVMMEHLKQQKDVYM